jgi:hypothetical protein
MTYTEANKKMKELADDSFLEKLVEISKLYGWTGDYIEIGSFVEELFAIAGKIVPNLEPYILKDLDNLEKN